MCSPIDNVTKDDFKIEKVVGKGGFGTVYLVVHKYTEQIYAMKVVTKELLLMTDQDESIKSKLIQLVTNSILFCKVEREILSTIDHPFIMRLEYAFHDEYQLYLIMEFVNGGELFTHLQQKRTKDRGFEEPLAQFYAA